MHPAPQDVPTVRDGAAARAVDRRRDQAATRVLPLPRRKRYTLNFDLDAIVPATAEPNAPRAVLDL
jgi:hypothetical protein